MASDFVFDIINKEYAGSPRLRELLLTHSECVARKALTIVEECRLQGSVDVRFVEDAAMLHDVGVIMTDAPSIFCHGEKPYICHGVEGRKILDRYGLPNAFGLVCERHTGAGITREEVISARLPLPPADYLPLSIEEKLICYADKFFSKSRDPRQEKSLQQVINSMKRFGPAVESRFMKLHELFSPV